MNSNMTFLSDCFFLFGALFFIVGMIIALFSTSCWHYYRHLKDKWKGKVEGDAAFDEKAKGRRKLMRVGIVIALIGIIAFAVSGFIAVNIGF